MPLTGLFEGGEQLSETTAIYRGWTLRQRDAGLQIVFFHDPDMR